MAILVPAILTDNLKDLTAKIKLLSPFGERLQIDIIDGIFVSGKTILPSEIPDLPKNVVMELHFMVSHPATMLYSLSHPNLRSVIFHLESAHDPAAALATIPPGLEKGIAINPETPVEALKPFLKDIDLALLMSVHPGAQGRAFIPSVLPKISQLKQWRHDLLVEVDGGINIDNAGQVAATGADRIVVGSGILRSDDPLKTVKTLKKAIGDQT